MATLVTSTTINQPVETVFNYVVDVGNHKSWQASISDAQVSPAGPVGLGTTYVYTTKVMGQDYRSQMQVSAFEPNKTWAVKTVGVPNSVETVYAFAPVGDATQLTISMEVPPGAYPAPAEAAIKQQMQKSLEEQAARIKQAVGG
jgi:uncharacterized protein YndB with AHSA1/START domain